MDGSSVNETSEGGTAATGPPPTSSVCEETSCPVAAMPRFASERVDGGAILRSNGRMRCPVAVPSNCGSHVTHLRATRKSPQSSHRVARRAAPCRRWAISSLSTCREQAVGVRFMTQLTGVVKMIPSIEGPKRPTTPLFSQIGPLWPAPTKWPQRAPLLPSASANLANGRADSSDDGRPDASGDKRKQKKSGTDLWCVPGSRVCGTWLVGSGTRPGRRGRDADEQLATE